MKHTRVSLLALSALAGGVFVASAAKSVDMGTNYVVNATVTASPPPVLVNVFGLPVDTNTFLNTGYFTSINTDGSGKIDGVVDLSISNLTSDLAPYTEGLYIASASGKIGSTGNPPEPNVQLTLKGNGYAQNSIATTQAQSSVNLKFTSSGAPVMKSSSTIMFTNTINVIVLYPDGTTNYTYTFTPHYDEYYYPPVEDLWFNYFYSQKTFSTNSGTNFISQNNAVLYDVDDQYFGTPVTTDTNQTSTTSIGTNTFTIYPLAWDIHWNPGSGWYTNYGRYGLNSADVAAYVSAYLAAYQTTNLNPGEVDTTLYTTVTNPEVSYIFTNDQRSLSNSWSEIAGAITGQIKAGKTTHKVNSEYASFVESHSVYTLGIGTVTNNGSNITASYYLTQQSYDNNIFSIDDVSSLVAEVIMVNNKLYMADPSSQSFNGKGSVNTKKQTYSSNFKGVALSKGSSMKWTGSTVSNLLAGFTALTNIETIVNIASDPAVSTTSTNLGSPFYYWWGSYSSPTVTNVVDGTNVTTVDSYWDVAAAPIVETNVVANGIRSITLSGKVQGQKVANTPANNPDADWNDYLNSMD